MSHKEALSHLGFSHERLAFMLKEASEAQRFWNKSSLDERALHLRAFKEYLLSLAEPEKQLLTDQIGSSIADLLYHEYLPTLAAIAHLEQQLPSLIPFSRKAEGVRPFTQTKTLQLPLGTVLIFDQSSSPLFLPTLTALHSLACGNGTILIVEQGKAASYQVLSDLTARLNLPKNLFQIAHLGESSSLPKFPDDQHLDAFIHLIDCNLDQGSPPPFNQLGLPAYQCLGNAHSVFVALSDAPLDLLIPALKSEIRVLSNLKTAGLTVCVQERLRETLCNSLPELSSYQERISDAPAHQDSTVYLHTFHSVTELKEIVCTIKKTPIDLSLFSKNSAQCLSLAADLPVSKVSLNQPPMLGSQSLHLRPHLNNAFSSVNSTFTLQQVLTRQQRITLPLAAPVRLRSPFWDSPSDSRIQLLRYLGELYRLSPLRRIKAIPNILWHLLHILKGER